MNIFKRLVKGELSLAVTFWVFGCLSGLIFSFLVAILLPLQIPLMQKQILLAFVCLVRFIIILMVLIGIFFILRNKKITFCGVIAFVISILATLNAGLFAAVSVSILFS